MKKLLAIINNPNESKFFIEYVLSLASDLHSQVYLLYIQNPNAYPLGLASTGSINAAQIKRSLDNDVQIAKNIIDQHLDDFKNIIPNDISISTIVKVGMSNAIIKDFIDENSANMVVLESSGNNNFWVEVSSNMGIIESVDCPVWVIPKNAKYKPFRDIIYATDYLEADVPTLKKLVYLTNNYLPKITALHITENLDFEEIIKKAGFLDVVRKETAYDNINIEAINAFRDSSIAEVINDYTSQVKGDLVVVLKENQNFLERIFKSQPSEKIIKNLDLPVLIFHEPL